MTITITPNDYKEVTECREEIVQYIVDAFLNWMSFRPNRTTYHSPTRYVMIKDGKGFDFSERPEGNHWADTTELIYKCEVELAVKLLIQNGYSLYTWNDCGVSGYNHYGFDKSPRRTDKTKVTHISEYDWSHLFI